jgi:hypothetical protein
MKQYTAENLLDILASYVRMIERDNEEHAAVILDDIYHSIKFILKENKIRAKYEE